MKLRSPRFSSLIAVTVCVLSGCAGAPKNGVETQAAQVKVYGPSQLSLDQYEGLRYLWVESWRTAFWLPSASSEAEGIASLQAEAARLGANGLINVVCMDQGHFIWSWSRKTSILCYGHAIRVR
jgi:uncharacterized protein YbjQ (UPF0145 family)